MASIPLRYPADDTQADMSLPEEDIISSSPERASTPVMSSEDSEAVLLNSVPTEKAERPPPPSRASTLGIKKCWICVGDSTEDDPTRPPVWRAPCKCSLTAHEACLLDWVADLENPRNRRNRPPPTTILCPQCKSEIKIARPQSLVVNSVKAADRAFGRMVIPGLVLSSVGTIFAGCWVHGFQSVLLVFGQKDAESIFRSAEGRPGNLLAYSMIPLNLIFARTRYADFVLPAGTLFLLSTQITDNFAIDWTVWPPQPSTVFACLPALRSAYNWSYNRLLGDLNRKWLQEVQPRRDGFEDQEQNIADIMNDQEARGGEIVLEVEVNMGVGDEAGEPAAEAAAGPEVAGAGGQQQANGGHVHHILGDRGDEIMEGTSSIGQSVLGALMFPGVAAGMGGLISNLLPTSWLSSANTMNGRPGMLRTKWGRSVVGGCLFVVLKDAIVLYCRWKLAQSHRQRKIMDFDKQKKEYALS